MKGDDKKVSKLNDTELTKSMKSARKSEKSKRSAENGDRSPAPEDGPKSKSKEPDDGPRNEGGTDSVVLDMEEVDIEPQNSGILKTVWRF